MYIDEVFCQTKEAAQDSIVQRGYFRTARVKIGLVRFIGIVDIV